MQPSMMDSLDKLPELTKSIADQETAVSQYAQQLLQVGVALLNLLNL